MGMYGAIAQSMSRVMSLLPNGDSSTKVVYLYGKAIALGGLLPGEQWDTSEWGPPPSIFPSSSPSSSSSSSSSQSQSQSPSCDPDGNDGDTNEALLSPIDLTERVPLSTSSSLPHLRRAVRLACAQGTGEQVGDISRLGVETALRVWREKEKLRKARADPLAEELVGVLDGQMEERKAAVEAMVASGVLSREEGEAQVSHVESVYATKKSDIYVALSAGTPSLGPDEIPHSLCCPISFTFMHDPVITPSGVSYARDSLLAVIRGGNGNAVDPLTRAPLTLDDLTPNIALRDTAEWFVDTFPWVEELHDSEL